MKRTVTILGLSLLLSAPVAFAQKPMDTAKEKAVQITQGPTITNITGTSATMNWTTNASGANRVRYRVAGSNSEWKTATHPGGGTNHSVQLTGLEPGKTYEWQILTNEGDLRTSGQFQSAATANGTAPDVNAAGTPAAGTPAAGTPAQGGGSPGAKVELYRSANSGGNLHSYTTNAAEQTANGFHAEGPAGYVLSSAASGAVQLYRITNANGDTVLTTDSGDLARLQSAGYHDNGNVGYISSSQVAGTQPLHRLINKDGSAHIFTASASEVTQLQSQGWKEEGITGYIWTQP